ncbi:helix-turn-helix domain-containing protein [Amycolatopsis sp. lyj-23]|uniref:helix-turn-helix domain-containing protein n=1 Tax=Amycolatopsis sp. lyj-23 TaxID=2789283 RepID=UPI00397B9654
MGGHRQFGTSTEDAVRMMWAVIGRPHEKVPDTRLSGGWLRYMRARKRMSVTKVAAKVGVGSAYLRSVELGRRALVSVELVARLAEAIGVSPEVLVMRVVYDFRPLDDRHSNKRPSEGDRPEVNGRE